MSANLAPKLRRVMLWIHGWIGITLGAWLAIVGLSGSVLVWRAEVQPQLQARQMTVPARATQVPLQTVFRAVETAYPGQRVARIFLPRAPRRTIEVDLSGPKRSVFVDPYSGAIVAQSGQTRSFYDWADELHVRLLAGDVGHFLVGIGGFALLTMALGGLCLWWPQRAGWRQALVPKLATNWRGRNSELHRAFGFFACLLLMLCSVTGIALVWKDQTSRALALVLPNRRDAKVSRAQVGPWLPLDDLAARALAALPGGEISRITWPKKKGASLVMRVRMPGELNPAGNSAVSLDPTSGRVLKREDGREADALARAMNLRYPLHTGLWGGVAVKILYSLLGLSLPAFYVSGLMLWAFKFQKKRRSARKPRIAAAASV